MSKITYFTIPLLFSICACLPLSSAKAAKYEEMEVPALNQVLRQGDIIKADDITYIEERANRLSRSVITDASDLIGKTPRRTLQPDRPLRITDVMVPAIIHKGDIVNIIWKKGGITLTTRGRAMDNAGQDEALRLSNTSTSRIIEARAVSPSEAIIVAK